MFLVSVLYFCRTFVLIHDHINAYVFAPPPPPKQAKYSISPHISNKNTLLSPYL